MQSRESRVTISALQQMKRDRRKIVGVVAWDFQIAQIVDRAGVDIVWRAVSSIGTNPPLYLDCLHRNLHAIGYCCAPAAGGAIGADPLVEAQFAVLGRLIRRRGIDVLEAESASGLALGSAMLLLKALRYAVRLGERFADIDSESGFPSRVAADREQETRRIRFLVGAGLLAATFLVCVHVGKAASAPWSAWVSVAAAAVFATLVGVVVRLD